MDIMLGSKPNLLQPMMLIANQQSKNKQWSKMYRWFEINADQETTLK